MNVFAPTATSSPTQPSPAPIPHRPALLGPALRAIIFKELRTNFPYAIALICLMGLAAWAPQALNMFNEGATRALFDKNILATNAYRTLAPPLIAVIGLLLGITARSPQESVQWALLVHRPINRGWIFVGRLIAGLVVYGTAIVLPAALLLLYAAKGWGIPFHWRMTLPTVADVGCGFVYYLAGMLAADRRAMMVWRALPLFAAVVCSLLVLGLPSFLLAMVANLVMAVVLGVAVLGAQHSDGYVLRAPPATRAALFVALFLGLTVPVALLGTSFNALAGAVEEWRASRLPQPHPRLITRTGAQFLPDGTVGRRRIDYRELATASAPDPKDTGPHLSGHYLPLDSDTPLNPQPTLEQLVEMQQHSTFSSSELTSARVPWRGQFAPEGSDPYPSSIVDPSGVSQNVLNLPEKQGDIWFSIPEAGVIRGYVLSTHQFIGTLAANGFVLPGQTAEPFTGPSLWSPRGPKGFYALAPARRRVWLSVPLPPGLDVKAFRMLQVYAGDDQRQFWGQVVVAKDRVIVFMPDHLPAGIRETTYHPTVTLMRSDLDAPCVQLVNFASPQGGVRTWGIAYGDYVTGESVANEYIEWVGGARAFDIFDPQGKLLSHTPITPAVLGDPPVPSTPQEFVTIGNESQATRGIADGLTNLPATIALATLNDLDTRGAAPPSNRLLLIRFALKDPWYMGGVIATLILSALITLLVGRRYHLPWLPLWALATLLFGPTVLLLLVITHTLPRREACPNCGRRRFVSDAECPKCHAQFTPPAPNGSEIFA